MIVTFPIKDINGKVLFVAKRSVDTKFFALPKDLEKPLCYLYEAKKYFPDSKELYICESLFNALTMVKYGLPAIALLGTGTKEQVEALKGLDYRKYILCLDNDMAGRAGMNKLYKSLYKCKLINYLIAPVGKDINDFVNEGKNFLKNFSKTP